MTCIRCGHEHERKWSGHQDHDPETCIANLRGDLEEARRDLADADDAEREDDARHRAIRESSTAMMRQALGPEMFGRLWGPELERLGAAFDDVRADLEAERARSWHGWAMADEWERRFVAWVSGVSLPALLDSWRTRS